MNKTPLGNCRMRMAGFRVMARNAGLPASLIPARRDGYGARAYERIHAQGAFHSQGKTEVAR
jgi:6-phosphogluconate dehydrogenase